MTKSVLLVGRETYIGAKISERLGLEGRGVVALGAEGSKYVDLIRWDRASFLSAQTAVRESIRTHGFPEEIFIVFGRKRDETFPDARPIAIDETIDGELKALIYLTQELYKRALERQDGETSLYFVGDNVNDGKRPISCAAASGFKTFCCTIMNEAIPLYMAGFELDGDEEDAFVDFVLKCTADRAPKRRNTWTVYPKPKLFGMGRSK